ncbi:MAG: EFR1 family ferrodoxin [Clostridiales bacterium]|nr:EFR1 family ferrodoxin [Clostridiales bacterium]
MKILLIYFSGTGNTKRITELYKSEFDKLVYETDTVELPDGTDALKQINADAYELIGFGYPIHAFNAPKVILRACKALPKQRKRNGSITEKRVFVFKTSGEPVRMSDVSSLKMRNILKRRGYRVTNEYQYVMPYNIIFRHTDKQVYKMWQTAQALVPAHIAEITSGISHLPKKIFMGGFLAWVLRAEHWGAHINGKLYRATKNCVKCGKCVKLCPVNNIRIKKNGKVKFGGKCIMCMRCSMYCPKNAIELGLFKSWKVNGEYSFAPPSETEPQESKHDKYCLKAYNRYYAQAEKTIAEFTKIDNDKIKTD